MDDETARALLASQRAQNRAMRAVEEQLVRLFTVQQIIERRTAYLEPADSPEGPSPAVREAQDALVVEALAVPRGLLGWLRHAPTSAWRWLAADKVRAVALVAVLVGVGRELAAGSELLPAIGRAILGYFSTGSAP